MDMREGRGGEDSGGRKKKRLGKKSSFTGPAVLTPLSLADAAEKMGAKARNV